MGHSGLSAQWLKILKSDPEIRKGNQKLHRVTLKEKYGVEKNGKELMGDSPKNPKGGRPKKVDSGKVAAAKNGKGVSGKLPKTKGGRPTKNQVSQEAAAKLTGVSVRSVRHAEDLVAAAERYKFSYIVTFVFLPLLWATTPLEHENRL
jgi:hypothetical protein